MALLQQYWLWLAGVFGLIAIYLALFFLARRYTRAVKQRLEPYLNQTSAPIPTPSVPSSSTPDSATLAFHKQVIWAAIQKYPLPPVPQIETLVNQLAATKVDLEFEKIYGAIVRSQLVFLRALNSQMGTVQRSEAENFLRTVGAQNETVKGYVFKDWMQFSVINGLVSANVDSFSITPKGQDFLVWVTRFQRPDTHE